MKYHAVICDMDGLLLDSERIALKTFIEACKSLGVKADASIYMKCIGANSTKTKEILMDGYGETFPYDEVASIWLEKYAVEAFKKPVPLKEGAEGLLKKIKRACIPTAVATSTAHDKAIQKLQNAGILKYFEVIVAGDQVTNSKPDPEIYIKVAKRLGIPTNRCVALEDSDNGVRAAYGAGMPVIQIPDLVDPSDSVKAFGHKIVRSLDEVWAHLTG